jgi:filamentous hemagglutinin family protein
VRSSFSIIFGILLLLAANSVTEAGDILRGGATAGSVRSGTTVYGTDAATTAQARSNANDVLSRTTQSIQAVRAMQVAARAAAVSGANNLGADPNHPGLTLPNVPNGLVTGGLQVDTVTPLWQGANQPVQSVQNGSTNVSITQTQAQALLNWKTFNVGKQTTVNFDQSAGGADKSKWIAFNKINDPSGVPSQILGSIKADGQVYLINQNGIIFGGSSQINLHNLTASSLPINGNLVSQGLLNNPDSQFLFSSLSQPAGNNGTPAFTPPAAPQTPGGKIGDVVVQAGAVITSPTTSDHVGGRVALIGPNVKNAGTISTPDGQTILAAGNQVGLVAHDTSDPSLRGLDVYVGSVDSSSGTATNTGLIDAPRANVTIAGKTVSQLGAINSSTSVSLNGRIDLLANYNAAANPSSSTSSGLPFLFKSSGIVTLGDGSVTQILPELSSTETVAGTELALSSQVNIQGLGIHLGRQSTILANSGLVTLSAGVWDYVSGSSPQSHFIYTGGQIYLDADATVDVSGSVDVAVSASENLLTVQLRGAELADSPLLRNGVLRGETVTVDLRQTGILNGKRWYGTPLADLSAYLGLIQRSVGELTTAGGTVKFNAGDSVVMQKGASVNVSGGWVNYQGGTVQTTRLVYGGHVYDISQATPDRVYTGVYASQFVETHAKYGITKTFINPLALTNARYESGYLQGANGGGLSITAPAMALDGDLFGTTVAGPKQLRETSASSDMPGASSLALSFQSQKVNAPGSYSTIYPTTNVVFQNQFAQNPAAAFALDLSGNPVGLDAERKSTAYLSSGLLGSDGFGLLAVNDKDGTVTVSPGIGLAASAGGKISFSASNINIFGNVSAPGGTLDFTALNISPYESEQAAITQVVPAPNANSGIFHLSSGASLSTAGLVVDDRTTSQSLKNIPFSPNGGVINISAYTANLDRGSTVNVSGGYSLTAAGTGTYGNAGSISIKAGQDPVLLSVLGGKLQLGSTLLGYSGAQGGSLSILAPLVQVGGSTANADTLLLQPDFFSTGGFGSFAISGLGEATGQPDEYLPGVVIAPGTTIAPVSQGLVAVPNSNGTLAFKIVTKPVGVRTPVSLQFAATGVKNSLSGDLQVRGDLVLGVGATISTDPQATLTLSGNTAAILGSVYAPGGTIAISGGSNSSALYSDLHQHALTTVYIGSHSVLSAAGTVLLAPDAYGRRTGSVLPGGTISISGNIIAAAGSVLNVSGSSSTLDIPKYRFESLQTAKIPATSGLTAPLYNLSTAATRVDSSGGKITLTGGQMLFSDATLLGQAGGSTALGGTLSLSSGRYYVPGAIAPPLDTTLLVTQNGPVIPTALPDSTAAIGQRIYGAGSTSVIERGYFAANTFAGGGFDSLTLGGVVEFSGPVNISAKETIRVADSGLLFADSPVQLSARYFVLGTTFQAPVQAANITSPFATNLPPTYGTGSLTINASLIDVGSISFQNIGAATLAADNGDIRGNGTLDIAGNLTLRAGQIYPVSASYFTTVAYDYTANGSNKLGSVTITGSGTRAIPLSAGGKLAIYASNIQQNGVLRAPFGTITLGWDGAGTAPQDLLAGNTIAFPVTSQLVLGAGSKTSVSSVDPTTGAGTLIPYGVNLDGNTWIDPTGVDITGSGLATNSIQLSAGNITTAAGSLLDVRGGGDLYAYRWVQGNGGSTDILASTSSFAVIPGYAADYAPYAPFNAATDSTNLISGVDGYTNGTLKVGDRIYLAASNSLAAGYYTLLPARYALLPGAVLVTPKSGIQAGPTAELADGSSLVSGYRYNDLNTSRTVPKALSRFEVASSSVVRARAEYEDYFANSFLKQSAVSRSVAIPHLPVDSGSLVFLATQSMNLLGSVASPSVSGGRGSTVDISSALAFDISDNGGNAAPGVISLSAAVLNGFGADSLLIGGTRAQGTAGTTITVQAGKLTVDNSVTPLTGPDIILVAKQELNVAPNAVITQTGTPSFENSTLLIGDATVAGSGDGLLLRVTGDAGAQLIRSGVSSSTIPKMTVGANAKISGTSITLDSTSSTTLDPTAQLLGGVIALNSGRISLRFDNSVALQLNPGLVLAGDAFTGLQSAVSLSLTSYSALDLYGAGTFQTTGAFALHAAEIRGFTNGGTVTFSAPEIVLDNRANGTGPGAVAAAGGALVLDAGKIRLGAGAVNVDQFSNVSLVASGGVIAEGTGSLTVQKALTITAPIITGANAANSTITAGGALTLASGGTASVAGSLGASLTFTGASVAANTEILLPSGSLTLHATAGDVTVGGRLDVGGTAQTFYDLVKYTGGGQIALTSDTGNVSVSANGTLNVAAQPGAGDGGGVTVSAANGSFVTNGTLLGQGGAGGQSGTFSLDAKKIGSTIGIAGNGLGTVSTGDEITYHAGGGTGISGLADGTKYYVIKLNDGTIKLAATQANALAGTQINLLSTGNSAQTLEVTAGGSLLSVATSAVNPSGSLAPLASTLNAGGFTRSVFIRDRGDASVAVDGTVTAHTFNLSADSGSITVSSMINSSVWIDPGNTALGLINPEVTTGGSISLAASGSVIVLPTAKLTVAARDFSSAGKGGDITIEAGSEINGSYAVATPSGNTFTGSGFVDIQTGSTIDLSVAANIPSSAIAATAGTPVNFLNGSQGYDTVTASSVGTITLNDGTTIALAANAAVTVTGGKTVTLANNGTVTFAGSAALGKFSGTLHLRAPQTVVGTDLQVNPINGTIVGASSILVEGYRIFDLTNTGGLITNTGTLKATGGLMLAGNNVQGSVNANGQNFLGTAGTTTAGYTAMLNRLLANNSGLGSVFVLAPGAEIINRTGSVTLGSTASTTTADWNLATFRYGAKSAPGVLTIRAAGNLVLYNALSDGFTPTLANTNTSWLWLALLSNQNTLLPVNTQSWSYRLTAGADLSSADFGSVLPTTTLSTTNGFLQLGKNNGTNQLTINSGAQSSAAQTSTAIANRFQVIRTGTGNIEINAGRSVQLLNQFATIYTAGARVTNTGLGGTFDSVFFPTNDTTGVSNLGSNQQAYTPLYSLAGGNVSIFAQQNIEHLTRNAANQLVADSQFEMPTNWLYRRGYVGADGTFATMTVNGVSRVASTTWWIDFSNFFEGVGALGGGDVSLVAGQNVSNVDAVVPTNARMAKGTPSAGKLLELGGGNLLVSAGANIDAGVYYVENGTGTLTAGGQITTNATRAVSTASGNQNNSSTWLPTTLFVGNGGFNVSARGDIVLGPVANPFWLPSGLNNSYLYKTYFPTYSPDAYVDVSSLGGTLTLREEAVVGGTSSPLLQLWYGQQLLWSATGTQAASYSRPWLRLNESSVANFGTVSSVMPSNFSATAFSGDVNLVGDVTLFPSSDGGLDILAAGALNGLQAAGSSGSGSTNAWTYSTINVSDASPLNLRSITNPFSYQLIVATEGQPAATSPNNFLQFLDNSLVESGATAGSDIVSQAEQARHASGILHLNDTNPVHLYAENGDISGLTLFSPKAARVFSGRDIADVSLYIQNVADSDVSIVSGARDIIPYDGNSLLRVAANTGGNFLGDAPLAGDIQISGSGTLEILAGRNLDLGTGSNNSDGTGAGITSIGNVRNPYLGFAGANIIVGTGTGLAGGLSDGSLDFTDFITKFVGGNGGKYLSEVSTGGVDFNSLSPEEKDRIALGIFYLVLRDAGRDYASDSSTAYANGYAAIASLFPNAGAGNILTRGRDIRTKSGGDISIFAPGGSLTLANTTIGSPLAPPGIITESGGNISIGSCLD